MTTKVSRCASKFAVWACVGLVLLAPVVSVRALEAGTDASGRAALAPPETGGPEQQMGRDMQSVLSEFSASGALGQSPDQVSLRLQSPAHRVTALGALVDSTDASHARDGLHVLGATPGSMADRLDLRPGDVIIAVNGTSLRDLGADAQGRALAAATIRNVVAGLPNDATLNLDVMRAGSHVSLSGPLQAIYVPAMAVQIGAAAVAASADAQAPGEAGGCGRISSFDVAPRGERLYGARILLLDGTTPGPDGTRSFRVAAGVHHLLIAENIPTRELGIGEIGTLRRQTSKPLTVTVRPGTKVLIASQLHLDRASDLNHGGYWDPVAWKEVAEACP